MKKNSVNRDELYNLTVDVMALRQSFDEKDVQGTKDCCDQMSEAIDKINKTLSLSLIRGIGGPISSLNLYKKIMGELSDELADTGKISSIKNKALEILEDRIKDKLYERLYSEDKGRATTRLNMAETLYLSFKEQFGKVSEAYDIIGKLSGYDRIFIYEEDFESLTVKRLLDVYNVSGFAGFISEKDVYKLGDYKVMSYSEAGITDKDVLIIASRWQLRSYDKAEAVKNGVANILELNAFDDRTEEFYDNLPEDMMAYEMKMGVIKL